MAYLVDISAPRCRCGRPAKVRLFNRLNAVLGEFCRSCGNRLCTEHSELERRQTPATRVLTPERE